MRSSRSLSKRGQTKLEITSKLIALLVPEVKANGDYLFAGPGCPSRWHLDRDGLVVSLSSNVLLSPEDPCLSSLLDIWYEQMKVFSACWVPDKPWIPPDVIRLKRGPWLPRLGIASTDP
jgi:hypothetical protein